MTPLLHSLCVHIQPTKLFKSVENFFFSIIFHLRTYINSLFSIMLLAKLVIINLIPIISVVCHPTPSLAMCHGLQSNVRYTYHYRTLMFLNNDDHRGKEPVSFGYEGKFSVQNVWQNERGYMLKINFANNQVGNYIDRKGSHLRTLGYGSSGSTFSPLFVHIEDSDDTQEFKSFYRDHHESITISNLKKAIAFMLKTKRSSEVSDALSSYSFFQRVSKRNSKKFLSISNSN